MTNGTGTASLSGSVLTLTGVGTVTMDIAAHANYNDLNSGFGRVTDVINTGRVAVKESALIPNR